MFQNSFHVLSEISETNSKSTKTTKSKGKKIITTKEFLEMAYCNLVNDLSEIELTKFSPKVMHTALLYFAEHNNFAAASYLAKEYFTKKKSNNKIKIIDPKCLVTHIFAKHNNIPAISFFIKMGCDINSLDLDGNNIAYHLVVAGNLSRAKYFIKKGCDATIRNKFCRTIPYELVYLYDLATAKKFIREYKVDISICKRCTQCKYDNYYQRLVMSNHFDEAKKLILRENIPSVNKDCSLFILFASINDFRGAEYCLFRDRNNNTLTDVDVLGQTASHIFAQKNNFEAAKCCSEFNWLNPIKIYNMRNKAGQTVLDIFKNKKNSTAIEHIERMLCIPKYHENKKNIDKKIFTKNEIEKITKSFRIAKLVDESDFFKASLFE